MCVCVEAGWGQGSKEGGGGEEWMQCRYAVHSVLLVSAIKQGKMAVYGILVKVTFGNAVT